MSVSRFIDHVRGPGVHGSRPAAGDVAKGTLYSCTTHNLVYQSDGATWTTWYDPSTASGIVDAAGDLLYGSADNSLARLAVGSTGQVLTVAGGLPVWSTPASGITMEDARDGIWAALHFNSPVTGQVNDGADTITIGLVNSGQPEVLMVAISDESTAVTTGTAKVTMRMPFAMTLTAVRLSATVASSSGTPTVDINEGGASILSTKLTLDVGETTSTTAAVPAVISDASLADDAEITFDVDVAGTGTKGLKVVLIGTRT